MTPAYNAARANLVSAIVAVRHTLLSQKATTATDYKQAIQSAAQGQPDEHTLRDRIVALILLYAFLAYQDGLDESGADKGRQFDNRYQTQATVEAWAAGQAAFAAGLAQAMANNNAIQSTPIGSTAPITIIGGGGATQAGPGAIIVNEQVRQTSAQAVDDRIGLWGESLNAFKVQGMADGAKLGGSEPFCHWVLGPTDDHCTSERGMTGCVELSQHSPEPLSFWVTNGFVPRAPGNPDVTCGGYNCKCRLLDADGKQIM